ncbi:N-acetylmuramoyl-L-alanine amidase [Bacillus haynesii]|uniref:N-acetylmuramoyl-L-alanine amidase n=1 Tax=Bacillus TaxID=1386 RepID=UPI00227FF883|nr:MULTISPECIES: N-acetylmuramoyl-L-alanine amidase [Bacillus]MCY7773466.1 N-acetylmuramoyl-L-alanine amidase [Bacillus licheniformis]MCY7780178.1 N-acetylmuramoyl-L-alanine amidase [Bacillus haynesii]MCY8021511.1 N-acetylmuramoyl-L-alanine amidase [Bacillus licheniformis]MCY8530053.1 N-acetylmuramoyl-L-alanine amidase [Bacillus licheniformis]MCY9266903.1 N-acetylmuramoyl-L-alanine amidase [Bacillus licheniformis]
MKRLMVCILVITLLSGMSQDVKASGNDVYIVGTSSLNIRNAPHINAPVIGSLRRGSIVQVEEKNYGWAKILYNGRTGWVASTYLYESSSNEASETSYQKSYTGKIYVAGSHVRIRTGPGTDYKVIKIANQGDAYQVLDRKGQWVHIQINSTQTGWIAGWLVSDSSQSGSSVSKSSSQTSNSLSGKNIVIDAGHGGIDPGTIGYNGSLEKNHTLATSSHLASLLKERGANVILTRSTDRYLSLNRRVVISSSYNTDAFVSIHYNSSPAQLSHGVETYYYAGDTDKSLAANILRNVTSQTGFQSNGVRFGDFYVLRENPKLAVLVELGYISNPNEESNIQSETYQMRAANGIVQGLSDYFSS